MTRWYGISQDVASNVFKSFDPSKFMVYFVDEDDPEERSPEALNLHAAHMRDAFNDDRRIVAVVKGSMEFSALARRTLADLFEAVVIAGNLNVLRQLDVKIVDEGWKEGDAQMIFDDIMARPDPEAERP